MKANTETVTVNGLLQQQGATKDYVISGTKSVVFNLQDGESLVESGDTIMITYIKG